jgi:plastocyanin
LHSRTIWPAMLAGGLLLGLAAIMGAALSGPSAGAQSNPSDDDHEVWITDVGFNPVSCTIRRTDNVRFVNKSGTVRDVVFDNIPAHPSDPNTPLSTGDIPPGGSSTSFSFDFGGSNPYHDRYTPSFTGSITTTVSGAVNCTQATPTPTPTNTPTVTPTPSATPTPPRSPACGVQAGCAIAPAVARDE